MSEHLQLLSKTASSFPSSLPSPQQLNTCTLHLSLPLQITAYFNRLPPTCPPLLPPHYFSPDPMAPKHSKAALLDFRWSLSQSATLEKKTKHPPNCLFVLFVGLLTYQRRPGYKLKAPAHVREGKRHHQLGPCNSVLIKKYKG